MINRNNKKGFTIVELVIVIAVIAILAAVLIPTFSGIIKKANISKDTQLAKNLNTILLSEEAEGNKPENFSDVLAVLRANGYIVENLNPTTEGYFFVWESTTNQIILVDDKYQVSYSSKELEGAAATINLNWFFAVKDAELIADIKNHNGSVIPAVDTAWIAGDANKVTTLFKDGGVVTLNESITLTTAPDHPTSGGKDGIRIKDGQTVDLNLAGQTFTAAFETPSHRMFQVAVGTLNISDGTIVSSANLKADGNPSLYGIAWVGYNGEATLNIKNTNIVYTTDPTSNKPASLFMVTETGTLNITDSTVTFSNAIGAEVAGTATFENVTFKSAGEGTWADICVAVSVGGTATIKSGTYIAATSGNAGYCVGVLPSGGTLNISGGTFDGNLYIGTQSGAEADSVINITGGTFNGKAFNSLTEAQWLELLGASHEGKAVVTGAGTNNVIIKVAK